jgi:hypothetical protein
MTLGGTMKPFLDDEKEIERTERVILDSVAKRQVETRAKEEAKELDNHRTVLETAMKKKIRAAWERAHGKDYEQYLTPFMEELFK